MKYRKVLAVIFGVIFCVCSVESVVFGDENEVDYENNHEKYENAAEEKGRQILSGFPGWGSSATQTNVAQNYPNLRFMLVNRADTTQTLAFPLANIFEITKHPWFVQTSRTVLYAFGFTERMTSTSVQGIISGYAAQQDINIIIIDWSSYNGQSPTDYPTAIGNMKAIGSIIGIALSSPMWSYYLRRMHMVGHSLGAHLVAYINRGIPSALLATKIPEIIALDPAGPLMYDPNSNNKPLNSGDAKIVQVIHTDMKGLGAPYKSGSIDFYPNGGGSNGIQPGCPLLDTNNTFAEGNLCSHGRAVQYFVESLKTTTYDAFKAVECESYAYFILGRCQHEYETMGLKKESTWGLWNNVKTGDFYLQTNSFSPFNRGLAGMSYSFTAP